MNISTAKRLQTTEEYYFSAKLREIEQLNNQGKNVINLGIGSPDLAPHPTVIDELCHTAIKENVHAYQSYKGINDLRKAIAQWYHQHYEVVLDPQTEILPLMGSKEGIMHICMTYFEEGDVVLIPNPGYPTYAAAVKLSGATVCDYDLKEENNYEPDFGYLQKLVTENCNKGKNVKGLFLNYPHMPTGTAASITVLEKFVRFAKANNILLIHDNPYSFILNNHPFSILKIPLAKEVALELNSLSKSHSMAGWRIGMLCGSKDKIDNVLKFKSNMDSGMFLPIQLAAIKALRLDKSYFENLNTIYAARRNKVFELLQVLRCSFNEQQAGMFVWAKVSNFFAEQSLKANAANAGMYMSDYILHNAAVFITPGFIFGSNGNNYIRVSLCSHEAILEEAINRIKQII